MLEGNKTNAKLTLTWNQVFDSGILIDNKKRDILQSVKKTLYVVDVKKNEPDERTCTKP